MASLVLSSRPQASFASSLYAEHDALGMEYPSGYPGAAVLDVIPHSSECTPSLLTDRLGEAGKSLT